MATSKLPCLAQLYSLENGIWPLLPCISDVGMRRTYTLALLTLLQVILPLGEEPDRRAGKDPCDDSRRYPPGGKCIKGVTGEVVCIRKAPDLEAVRRRVLAKS